MINEMIIKKGGGRRSGRSLKRPTALEYISGSITGIHPMEIWQIRAEDSAMDCIGLQH